MIAFFTLAVAVSQPTEPYGSLVAVFSPLAYFAASVPAVKGPPLPPGALLRLGSATFRHANQTNAIVTPDGTQLITVSAQTKTIKVWDLLAGTVIREMNFSTAGYANDCFAWSPDGKTFATLGRDMSGSS